MGKVSEEDMLEYSSRHLTLIVPLYMHTILTELSGFLQINICNEVCLCMCDQKFFFFLQQSGKGESRIVWGQLWTGIWTPTNTILSVLQRGCRWHLRESVYSPLNYTIVHARRKSATKGKTEDGKTVLCDSKRKVLMRSWYPEATFSDEFSQQSLGSLSWSSLRLPAKPLPEVMDVAFATS